MSAQLVLIIHYLISSSCLFHSLGLVRVDKSIIIISDFWFHSASRMLTCKRRQHVQALILQLVSGVWYNHRRRYGWNSGGRTASAEGRSVPSEVRYGEGCSLSIRLLVGLAEHSELPSRVHGSRTVPAKSGFWRILKATKRSFYRAAWNADAVLR